MRSNDRYADLAVGFSAARSAFGSLPVLKHVCQISGNCFSFWFPQTFE